MNSRERVMTALKRDGLPDRVPLQFDLCRPKLDQFSEKYGIPVHYTQSILEDLTYRISGNELRTAMGSDCVLVGIGLPRGYSHQVDESGHIIDEFGVVMRQGPLYVEPIGHPLANVKYPKEVEQFPFPDPLADGRYDDAEMYIEKYKGEFFIWGDCEIGMFMMKPLVGVEKCLIDMARGEPYLEPLRDKALEFTLEAAKKLVSLGVDGLLLNSDYGAQHGMLISPKMWRDYFKEGHRHMHSTLKSLNPDLIIAQHSCGSVAPILGELAETGVEVYNPVQLNVKDHDPTYLKRQFGDKLSFWGGIDAQQLLPFGTPEEIETEVKRVMSVLGEGGGLLVSPAHIVQADKPIENVEAFINAVKMHGVYS